MLEDNFNVVYNMLFIIIYHEHTVSIHSRYEIMGIYIAIFFFCVFVDLFRRDSEYY